MQFLMLFDDLYDLEVGPTTIYEDAAKAKYDSVSYTHLRAHETVLDIVCSLLLEKKKN